MRRFAAVAAALALVLVFASSAVAAKPTIFTVPVDEQSLQPLCRGFAVAIDATCHFRVAQYFDKAGNIFMEIQNFAIQVTYSANGRTVEVVDTGVDLVKFAADGSFTVAITGNVQLVTATGDGVVGGDAGRLLLAFSPTFEVTV